MLTHVEQVLMSKSESFVALISFCIAGQDGKHEYYGMKFFFFCYVAWLAVELLADFKL